MSREEEFKAKFFALLKEYNVEIEAVEDTRGWDSSYCSGINFYSWGEDTIDFTLGKSIDKNG